MPIRFTPSPTTSLAEVVASRTRSRTSTGARAEHQDVAARAQITGRSPRSASVPPSSPTPKSRKRRAAARPPVYITAEQEAKHEASPISRLLVDAIGQRSVSPQVKPEPEDFFANIKGSRGEDAIRIDLTVEDDGDEVESLLLRQKGSKASLLKLDVSSAPPLSTTISWTRRLTRLITWLATTILMLWLGIAALAVTQKLYREYHTPHAEIPLEYIAWSVGSNALHARDIMQHMLPIRRIGRIMFNKADVERLAMDLDRLSQDTQLPNAMRQYVASIETLHDEVRPLNLRGNIAFRDIVKDLSKSDKLIKRLYPPRHHSSNPAPLPEIQYQLINTLSKLYVEKIPRDINALYTSFIPAELQIQRTTALVQELITALSGDEVTEVLQLKPPIWRRSAWEKDDVIQRRVKHAGATVESFQKMMDLARAFEGTKVALWKYRQSLNLFLDPRNLPPNHRRSNGTFEDFVNLIDEVMPQLSALLSSYETS
ncbi:hypothetical protein FRB96_003624 [Tulasnella sp. 330]|nr:hypothetical protein FRB96_003624 [Tulasnella sp. 330]